MIPIETICTSMYKDGILHLSLQFPKADKETSDMVSREFVPSNLEYIFKIISERFSFIMVEEAGFQRPDFPKGIFRVQLQVSHIPFSDNENPIENQYWNTLVTSICEDFEVRLQKNDWGIDYDRLRDLITECWNDFEVVDRKRLDVEKLYNLVLFVMDFCKLTLSTSKIHPNLFDYMPVHIKIGEKSQYVSKRTADRMKEYLKAPFTLVDGNKMINYELPPVYYETIMANPQANGKNSYMAAMFIDIMHHFFLSFDLKKWGGRTEWSSAETALLHEVLHFFGVCKSKPTPKSSYVKSIMNDYRAYFDKCSLHSWLRYDQEYSYLMNKRFDEIFSKEYGHEE